MKAIAFVTLFLALSFPALSRAQSDQSILQSHLTRSQLHRQIENAHTPAQYQSLASYFRNQQKLALDKADAEKLAWETRAQNTVASGEKYPRPADSAHYRYDSYSYDAGRFGKLAEQYEQLANSVGGSPKLQATPNYN